MGIQHAQASAFVKEMQKWESRPVMIGDTMIMPIPHDQGGRMNHPFEEYPKMLYRVEDSDRQQQVSGYVTVRDESEERMKLGLGWSLSQEEALERARKTQLEVATLAANREFHDARMSPNARAEALSVDQATVAHLPAIPETPIRKAGSSAKG